jgi:hypothetical protein
MAKRPSPGLCVHCRLHFDELTWDHVFPRGWYPENTPENLEKWKIPACLKCNREYGELEQDLLLRLGMSIGREEARASGIADKVIRSMDPSAAHDEKDRAARARRHAALGKEMIDVADGAQSAILPGFGPNPDPAKRSSRGVLVPKESLERLGEKIVRGLTYLLAGKLIGDEYLLEVFVINGEAALPVNEILERHGVRHERGPGVTVRHAPAGDDPTSGVFEIEIWGRLKLYAGVHPRVPEVSSDAKYEQPGR